MLNSAKLLKGALLASLFMLGPIVSAHADTNLLTNGSFEDGNFVPDGGGYDSKFPGSTDITGWTVTNAELAWASNSSVDGLKASDGDKFLDLTGYHDSAPYGGLSQTINTLVGRTYTVSFDIGDSANNAAFNGPVSVLATAGSSGGVFTLGPSVSGNQWQTYTYQFKATSESTDVSFTGNSGIAYIGLDNASVTLAPVPEASTMVLFALGAGALLLVARKRSDQTLA